MKAITVLLAALPAVLGWATPWQEGAGAGSSRVARRPRAADAMATAAMPLKRMRNTRGAPRSRFGKSIAKALLKSRVSRRDTELNDIIEVDPNSNKLNDLLYLYYTNYVGSLTIAGETMNVIVDTGSSDTWIVKDGFNCTDVEDALIPPEECYFGPRFNGSFSGDVGGAARFDLLFADGSSVTGSAGYADVGVSGMTAKMQEFILIDAASYLGDGYTSGTMGLAYPITTRIYSSDDFDHQYPGSPEQMRYDPIFTSLVKQGQTSPIFSLAMDKESGNGYLAFGGLPPVPHSNDYASTPIRMVIADDAPALSKDFSYYTIVPDGFVYGSMTTANYTYHTSPWNASGQAGVGASQFPVVLDSATTLSILPEAIVRDYARQVGRPVRKSQGNYWAHCDAKLPPFGVTIGGRTFYMEEADLLQQDITAEFTETSGQVGTYCALGLLDILPDGPYILGASFLDAVVSVFDVGASEMRFYGKK